MKLPDKLKILFWDVNIKDINSSNNRDFVIPRILEKGNFESINWLFRKYSKSEITNSVKNSPNLSNSTKNFWKVVLSTYESTSL